MPTIIRSIFSINGDVQVVADLDPKKVDRVRHRKLKADLRPERLKVLFSAWGMEDEESEKTGWYAHAAFVTGPRILKDESEGAIITQEFLSLDDEASGSIPTWLPEAVAELAQHVATGARTVTTPSRSENVQKQWQEALADRGKEQTDQFSRANELLIRSPHWRERLETIISLGPHTEDTYLAELTSKSPNAPMRHALWHVVIDGKECHQLGRTSDEAMLIYLAAKYSDSDVAAYPYAARVLGMPNF